MDRNSLRSHRSGDTVTVRLVRACGSKPPVPEESEAVGGQARKSLWIETERYRKIICVRKVRLVRACGSKPYITLAFNVIVGSGS